MWTKETGKIEVEVCMEKTRLIKNFYSAVQGKTSICKETAKFAIILVNFCTHAIFKNKLCRDINWE